MSTTTRFEISPVMIPTYALGNSFHQAVTSTVVGRRSSKCFHFTSAVLLRGLIGITLHPRFKYDSAAVRFGFDIYFFFSQFDGSDCWMSATDLPTALMREVCISWSRSVRSCIAS